MNLNQKFFKIVRFSKSIVKIKMALFPRCVKIDNNNVLLSNNSDIIIGNYLNTEIDNFIKIKNTLFKMIDAKKNIYYDYFYLPFSVFKP